MKPLRFSMVSRRADDAFTALLRSYHSRRFCRVAAGVRSGVAASRFSTSAFLKAASLRANKQESSEGIKPIVTQVPENVAIIGSGITGLTTAHYLAKWLPETSHITIYDAADRVGGWIDTQTYDINVDGHDIKVRFERGPRTLRGMGKDTWKLDDFVMWDLLRDLLMVEDYRGIPSPPRYIYYPDHLVQMTPWKALVEPVFKGAIRGFVHALYRRINARSETGPSDMSVAEFIKFATGRPELTDNMVSAMIHGIWGGDADKLSMRSFMPAQWWRFFLKPHEGGRHFIVPQSEFGLSRTLGADRQLRGWVRATQKDQLVFFKDGMSSLPNAIERDLRKKKNVTFKLGEPVEKLRYDKRRETVAVTPSNSESPVYFDKVISTTTSKALNAMVSGGRGQARASLIPSLANSPNVSIMAVNMWYPEPNLNHKHHGVGYLVPRSVKDNPEGLLGVFFDSDVVPLAEGETEGTKLFVLMGGHYWDNRPTPPTEDEGIEMAKAVLERHLGIPKDQPCFALAKFAKDCIPQHHAGHWKRMAFADSEMDYEFRGQLGVAGGSYTSIGVMGGIRAGYDMARHISKATQEHVGETGLGQFQERRPQLGHMSRSFLVDIGRDIAPKAGWLQRMFG